MCIKSQEGWWNRHIAIEWGNIMIILCETIPFLFPSHLSAVLQTLFSE